MMGETEGCLLEDLVLEEPEHLLGKGMDLRVKATSLLLWLLLRLGILLWLTILLWLAVLLRLAILLGRRLVAARSLGDRSSTKLGGESGHRSRLVLSEAPLATRWHVGAAWRPVVGRHFVHDAGGAARPDSASTAIDEVEVEHYRLVREVMKSIQT